MVKTPDTWPLVCKIDHGSLLIEPNWTLDKHPNFRDYLNIVKTFVKVVTYPKCPAGQGFSHCAPVQPPGHLQVPDTCQHSPPLRHVHVPMHRRPYVPSVS